MEVNSRSSEQGPFYGPMALKQIEKEMRERMFGIHTEPKPNKVSVTLFCASVILSVASFIIGFQFVAESHKTHASPSHIYGNHTITSDPVRSHRNIHIILFNVLLTIVIPLLVGLETTIPHLEGPKVLLRMIGLVIYITASSSYSQFPPVRVSSFHGLFASPATNVLLIITMIIWTLTSMGVLLPQVYSLRFIGSHLEEGSVFLSLFSSILVLLYLVTSITGIYELQSLYSPGLVVYGEALSITWTMHVSLLLLQLYNHHFILEHTRFLFRHEFTQHFFEFQKRNNEQHYSLQEEDIILRKGLIPRVNVPLRKS